MVQTSVLAGASHRRRRSGGTGLPRWKSHPPRKQWTHQRPGRSRVGCLQCRRETRLSVRHSSHCVVRLWELDQWLDVYVI